MPFDIPLPFELDEDEEERKRRQELAIAEAIQVEEAMTGARSPIRDDAPIEPTQGVEEPVSDSMLDSIINRYKAKGQAIHQFAKPPLNVVGGALGGIASAPWMMAGGAAAIPEVIDQAIGDPRRISARGTRLPEGAPDLPSMSGSAAWLMRQGKGAEHTILEALGLPTEPTGAAYVEQKLGQALTPGKLVPAAFATGGIAGSLMLSDLLNAPKPASFDERHPVEKPWGGPEWLSQALISPAEAGGSQTPDAKKRRSEQQQAAEARAKGFTGQMAFPNKDYTIVDTQGGPAKVKNSELYTLGGITVASMGMIFAPRLYHAFKWESLPKFRPVVNAAPGTMTATTPGDLFATYHDANAGLIRMAERVGVEPAVLQEIDQNFAIQGRMGGQAVADAAILGGRAETPTFTFTTRTPISDINRVDNPELSRYAHLWDTVDDIAAQEARVRATPSLATPGPITIRGHTHATAMTEINDLRRQNPNLPAVHREYRQFEKDVRHFEASGEYATLSKTEEARLNAENPNFVPFRGERVIQDPNYDRGSFSAVAGDVAHTRFTDRMNNELVGMYIDAVNRRRRHNGPNQQIFKQVTPEEIKLNKHWADEGRLISFKRRGETEHYTADPFLVDTLKLDPYYFSGMAGGVFALKRGVEIGATGLLAPWFIATNLLRSWQIAKFTTPNTALARSASGFNKPLSSPAYQSPGLLGTIAAIPQQLVPQVARAISQDLSRTQGGWLRQVFGQGNVDALGMRLAHAYDNSLYNMLQSAGSHKASILDQQSRGLVGLQNYISGKIHPQTKAILGGVKKVFEAMHNAGGFAFAAKNYGRVPLPELALTTRRLTGDPRTGGQYYTSGAKHRPIRFEDQASRVNQTRATIGRVALGWTSETGRLALPWFNATMQGVKRMGQSYVSNPAAFVGKAWIYTMLPSAATYLWSRSLGNDPNGRSYVDYHMNGRGDYPKTMEWYIALPGLPVEQGIRLPRFHEMAFPARMMEAAMDHMFRSSLFTEKEDFTRALWSILDIAIAPPAPPMFALALAKEGMAAPQGMFGGEAYRRRNNPYDSTSGLPTNIELTLRALASGIGEVAGQSAAAFFQTPKGIETAFNNAMKEAGTRMVSKTPLLRDVLGVYAPAAGTTNVTEQLFRKQATIDKLNNYYKTWGLTGEKDINVKPASKAGGVLAEQAIKEQGIDPMEGKSLSPTRTGLGQAEPTNPLYIESAKMIWAKFKKDAPLADPRMLPGKDDIYDPRSDPNDPLRKKLSQTPDAKRRREDKRVIAEARYQAALDEGGGGMGYKSLWNRYGDASAKLKDLYNVNAGNFVTWQERLHKRDPEGLKELQANNIPTNDHIAIRNFYERIRQSTGRTILFAIKEVEEELSKKYGTKITLEDLDPYGRGISGIGLDLVSLPGVR